MTILQFTIFLIIFFGSQLMMEKGQFAEWLALQKTSLVLLGSIGGMVTSVCIGYLFNINFVPIAATIFFGSVIVGKFRKILIK
ncbi:hypothetical protein ACWN8V_03935 [Vagococcus elongatus]|uniref:Uncharacterized protein n=1 Tax=Vagococcus elongatus TaxID=180344 RepID=A0A430AZZ7_9ENTE|nr:hypothetical protein [Vagococcus elongatus]RSU13572.1 hypothetical protein CBF29_04785 [Vagococcus elongatus]